MRNQVQSQDVSTKRTHARTLSAPSHERDFPRDSKQLNTEPSLDFMKDRTQPVLHMNLNGGENVDLRSKSAETELSSGNITPVVATDAQVAMFTALPALREDGSRYLPIPAVNTSCTHKARYLVDRSNTDYESHCSHLKTSGESSLDAPHCVVDTHIPKQQYVKQPERFTTETMPSQPVNTCQTRTSSTTQHCGFKDDISWAGDDTTSLRNANCFLETKTVNLQEEIGDERKDTHTIGLLSHEDKVPVRSLPLTATTKSATGLTSIKPHTSLENNSRNGDESTPSEHKGAQSLSEGICVAPTKRRGYVEIEGVNDEHLPSAYECIPVSEALSTQSMEIGHEKEQEKEEYDCTEERIKLNEVTIDQTAGDKVNGRLEHEYNIESKGTTSMHEEKQQEENKKVEQRQQGQEETELGQGEGNYKDEKAGSVTKQDQHVEGDERKTEAMAVKNRDEALNEVEEYISLGEQSPPQNSDDNFNSLELQSAVSTQEISKSPVNVFKSIHRLSSCYNKLSKTHEMTSTCLFQQNGKNENACHRLNQVYPGVCLTSLIIKASLNLNYMRAFSHFLFRVLFFIFYIFMYVFLFISRNYN